MQAFFDNINSKVVDDLRFIFTAPSFLKDGESKQRREFYIPRIDRERALYGSQFEVKLRNQLTQKAIAIECAEWIKEKVKFKSNVTSANMLGFINIENDDKQFADVTEQVAENISNVYKENSPEFIYFVALYNIFSEFLEDISEDVLPNEATGFKESQIWNTQTLET